MTTTLIPPPGPVEIELLDILPHYDLGDPRRDRQHGVVLECLGVQYERVPDQAGWEQTGRPLQPMIIVTCDRPGHDHADETNPGLTSFYDASVGVVALTTQVLDHRAAIARDLERITAGELDAEPADLLSSPDRPEPLYADLHCRLLGEDTSPIPVWCRWHPPAAVDPVRVYAAHRVVSDLRTGAARRTVYLPLQAVRVSG